MSKPDIRFIECTKHGVAQKRPWSIVCTHLLDVQSKSWNALPQEGKKVGRKEYFDYFCDECLEHLDEIMQQGKLDNLRPVCVDCVDTIRRVFDPNYKLIPTTRRQHDR